MPTVVHIGERLRRLRTLNALTQAQLAERAGVTTATVGRARRDRAAHDHDSETGRRFGRRAPPAGRVDPHKPWSSSLDFAAYQPRI
jgi:hypothetical protein